jgi:hypothetical protein
VPNNTDEEDRKATSWNKEVEDRLKTLRKTWLDEADKINAIYEAAADDESKEPFNILYSNTETLLPALYNSTPRPDVAKRYSQPASQRALDVAIGQTAERLLEYSTNTEIEEYEDYDTAVRAAVLAALVPGLGQVRVRSIEDSGHQEIAYDSLAYDRFVWGYARKWQNVPWVAFGYDMTREGFESQFEEFCKGDEYEKWSMSGAGWKALEEKSQGTDWTSKSPDSETGVKSGPTLLVWEVWNHQKKEVKFLCNTFKDEFLVEDDYPFHMTCRFPCPQPLTFALRNSNLTPRPLYAFYKAQAIELNEVSRRIGRVIAAVRARGAYDSRIKELEQIFGQDSDNALIPVQGMGALGDGSSLEKSIWMVPIEQLVEVLEKLYEARDQIKQTIYEITGIGDILRGQAEADVTAKAAGEANQWGTLRLKRMQRTVSLFCRDLFRVGFEFMANRYTVATMQSITKLPYLTKQEKQEYAQAMNKYAQMQAQAQQQYQMAQQQYQQLVQRVKAAQGQPPGPPGQPPGQPPQQQSQPAPALPPPPQPPPQSPPPVPQEKLDMMEEPTWEEIKKALGDRFERSYRIEVETNSTVDLEATEDKAAISEFMNAFGQMASGLVPLVEQGLISWEVLKVIMSEVFRRFRFARRIEEYLEMMKPPAGAGQNQNQGAAIQLQQAKAIKDEAEASVQKAMAQLERERVEHEKSTVELVKSLEKIKVELATARGAAQVSDKIAQLEGVKKDVDHAGKSLDMASKVTNANHQKTAADIAHQREGLSRDRMDLDRVNGQIQQNTKQLAAQQRQSPILAPSGQPFMTGI